MSCSSTFEKYLYNSQHISGRSKNRSLAITFDVDDLITICNNKRFFEDKY